MRPLHAARLAGLLAFWLTACGREAPPGAGPGGPDADGAILAGEAIGPVRLGARFADLRAQLGEPARSTPLLPRIWMSEYEALGLEVLLTSPGEDALDDAALVIAVGATTRAGFSGEARPGQTRAAIEAELGPGEPMTGRSYYPAGLAVEYVGDVAAKVAVFAPYALATAPPPMGHARRGGAQ